MENYLKISNQIEIELNAFHLIGACTKRNDNSKIGYFGSGLKYALAVLLRENIEFVVYSGLNKINITTQKEALRDEEFDVIYINNVKTSMTTSMGPKWKVWQALREIYCNAIDEENHFVEQVPDIRPIENETAFYINIENPAIKEFLDKWDSYFSFNRTPITENTIGKVFSRINPNITVYRKGIRALEDNIPSMYDYDFNKIDINESRLISYTWYMYDYAGTIWAESATKEMIDKLISMYGHPDCAKESFEHKLEFSPTRTYDFNDNWLNALEGKILVPFNTAGHFQIIMMEPNAVILSSELILALVKAYGDRITTAFTEFCREGKFIVTTISKRAQFLLDECLKFFAEVKIKINYPIKVVCFDSKNTLASAYKEEICLSETLFSMGKRKIVMAILEEHMHLDSQCSDETRDFQNYIINQLITMIENQYCIFL